MAVLRPLKVVITNYPEGQRKNWTPSTIPKTHRPVSRQVPFSRELYIEQEDFMEDPPKKFFRLAPGREVRLRYAYFITCRGSDQGRARQRRRTALHLRSGDARRRRSPDGRKVKATLHWVSADHAVDAEVRLYDHLFSKPDPEDVAAKAITSTT